MLTRMYLYSTSTKLSIDVWLYLDRPGSLTFANTFVLRSDNYHIQILALTAVPIKLLINPRH